MRLLISLKSSNIASGFTVDEKQPLTTSGFFYGVIEGFYGHQWSWSARAHYAAFLSELGYDCYIYAPKGDPFLRSRWREDYPEDEWIKLLELVYTQNQELPQ